MNTEAEAKSPPYASYTSFKNYLDHLRGSPLPHRLDKTVMAHLNHGTRQALIAALRFLGLVNEAYEPTPELEALVAADDQERPALLEGLLRAHYPYLWADLDLSRATPGQLEEAFRAQAKIAGSTVDKVITFFLSAASEAGIELSPHLNKRKPSGNGSAKRSRPKPKARRAKTEEATSETPPAPPRPPRPSFDMRERLLQKFPTFDPKWPDELKAQWFAGFDRLMTSVEKDSG